MMASFVAMLHDNRLRRELGRYVVVGLLGYGVQLGSFAVLVALGVGYLLAALVAGGLALLNNFLLNRHWTFEVAHGQVTRQARNYLLISAVFFAAQLAILHVLVVLGLPKVVAEGLSVFAVVPMNFLAQRRLAFRAW
jgi:putative flippase GtrA